MKYSIKTYPDGGKYVQITDYDDPEMVYRINSYEDLFLLKSIKDAWDSIGLKGDFNVTIPCMFQQQHDRRFNEGESFELKLVCDFINSCNFNSVKVFHPHSDVTRALLDRCSFISNTTFIRGVLSEIHKERHSKNGVLDDSHFDEKVESYLTLLSVDAGGFKSLMKLVDELKWKGETYSASKARAFVNGESILTQVIDKQDFNGKDVLITDDLCVYGGSFIGIAKMLKKRNIGKLYLAVSHMTVSNPNKELEIYYDKIFTTNSKYDSYNLSNIEVIKMF